MTKEIGVRKIMAKAKVVQVGLPVDSNAATGEFSGEVDNSPSEAGLASIIIESTPEFDLYTYPSARQKVYTELADAARAFWLALVDGKGAIPATVAETAVLRLIDQELYRASKY